MISEASLRSLHERVADAAAPERQLFVDVWFACTGKQPPDTKARFAILLEAKAWTDAAIRRQWLLRRQSTGYPEP